MIKFTSNKLIVVGIFFLIFALLFLAIYIIQYSVAYKNLFMSNDATLSKPSPKTIEIENNYTLSIPKISINAPIILDVDGNEETAYLAALEKGVAQLSGSAIPGQSGNSFIFGHSSYFFYAPGLYKSIFADLNQLKIGDTIIIKSDKNQYQYIVYEIRIVSPEEVEITKNIPDHPETLTLMTCTPTGTTLKRLIIFADLNN